MRKFGFLFVCKGHIFVSYVVKLLAAQVDGESTHCKLVMSDFTDSIVVQSVLRPRYCSR